VSGERVGGISSRRRSLAAPSSAPFGNRQRPPLPATLTRELGVLARPERVEDDLARGDADEAAAAEAADELLPGRRALGRRDLVARGAQLGLLRLGEALVEALVNDQARAGGQDEARDAAAGARH
jgi:hypothetical protein